MGRNLTLPSERLCVAAEISAVPFCRDDNKPYKAIDVGCDHAKLAVYLVQSGLCSHVTASDINDGPVEKARKNVASRSFMGNRLDKYISVVKTDGLVGLEKIDASRIFILGMGGELIADILQRADFIRDDEHKSRVRFVLQPMTSEDRLRVYLYTNGYNIEDERLVEDKGRIYAVISAVYDGITRSATPAQYLLGKANIDRGGKLFARRLERRIRICEAAIKERASGGLESCELDELLAEMKTIKGGENCGND